MPTEVLKYDLKIGTLSITDLSSAEVRDPLNEIPTAMFEISNKDGKYTNPAAFSEGDAVVFSASKDGTNYVRLHTGSVLSRAAGVDPNGRSMVTVRSRLDVLNHKYASFNNAVHRNKNFGAIFTGSNATDHEDEWPGTDSNGNYPNGLLYNSGVKWDSTNESDIFGGVADVPLIIHGNRSIYDTVRSICNIYGFDHQLFPSGSDVKLRTVRHSSTFPDAGITLAYGTDLNADSIEFDGKEKVNGLILIGANGTYYRTGSAPFAELTDDSIRNYDLAREKAQRWLEIHTKSVVHGQTTTPPITDNVVGRRVSVIDTARGWSAVGNVMAADHAISADRWTTNLTFDNVPAEAPKLMSDIITEIKELREREDIGSKYPGFAFVNFSSFGQVASSGSQYSASAIGFGRVGQEPLEILPVRVRDDPTYTFQITQLREKLRSRLLDTNSSKLLETLLLFENPNGTMSVASLSTVSTRPTSSTLFGTSSGSPFFAGLGYHVADVQDIYVKGKSFAPKDMEVRVWSYTGSFSDIPNMTSSAWAGSDVYRPTNEELVSMSWDAFSKSDGYYRMTTSSGGGPIGKRIIIKFAVPSQIPQSEQWGITGLHRTILARSWFTNTIGTPMNGIDRITWDHHDGTVSSQFNYSNSNQDQWHTISWVFNFGGVDPGFQLTPDGTHYFAIQVGGGGAVSASQTVTLDIAFVDCGFAIDRRVFVEHAGLVNPTLIEVASPISNLFGVFDNPAGTGSDYRLKSVETTVEEVWGFGPPFGLSRRVVTHPGLNAWWEIAENRRGIWGPWSEWRDQFTVSEFYVKYVPEGAVGPSQFDTQGWLLDRRSDYGGETKDYLWWVNGTSTANRYREHKPAYGLTYSVQYTVPGVVRGRYTDSVGWDFTPDKSLTLVLNKSG